jgi:2,5-dichloro-2,5-cyclohexadiene-1,4-diol dehydrogenase 1
LTGGQLDSKRILVTGGGSGIGRASALCFGSEGAEVVVADIDRTSAEETCNLLERAGAPRAFAQRVDVCDEGSVEALVAFCLAHLSGLDGAFNNAGISEAPTAFHDTPLETWQRVCGVDLTGVFLCMKHELRHMRGHGGGSIVNVSSVAGHAGAPGRTSYSAAKHGVLGLTKQAAREYARDGIRVNAVSPGLVDTPGLRDSIDAAGFAELAERTRPGRLARPEEVAAVATWLLSERSSYVSGETVVVDHGSLTR